jgi:SAM-dependent methyltransferase
MSDVAVRKRMYYAGGGMPPQLAARYWRMFDGARAVLDIGCGRGDLGRLKPDAGIDVHGVDIDVGAVEIASAHEHALHIDLEHDALPYDAATFDAVLAKDVLEHVTDPLRLTRDIWRVMRPDGVLVASVIIAKPKAVWNDYTHIRGFTKSAARLLVEDAGFRVERMWRMGPVPLSRRLGIIDAIPTILRLPVASHLWARSWELLARR